MWSSWPWVRKTAPTREARSRSQARSGTTTSAPTGSSGKSRPQSTTAMRPSHSTVRQFIPISPRPPRAATRTGGAMRRSLRPCPPGPPTALRLWWAAPMDPILDPLNDAQRDAVLHGDGPLLVLAGAGSGKTRVIVHRVAHLVRVRGIAPWHVLCVTFTNKAAGEMKERLADLLGPEAEQAWVQTFHAFGARFLRREAARAGLPESFAIYDDDDQRGLVKRILAEMGITDDGRIGPRQVLSRIDRWKNMGLA